MSHASVASAGTATDTFQGVPARPFWIFAHNPNTDGNVDAAITAGANALEPDLEVESNTAYCCSDSHEVNNYEKTQTQPGGEPWTGVFVYHDHVGILTRQPESLEQWLQHVHDKVAAGANIALISFDTKPDAATAVNVSVVHDAVNRILNTGGVKVNVLFNISDFTTSSASYFNGDDNLFRDDSLGPPYEGPMADGGAYPNQTYNYFDDGTSHSFKHSGYGVGALFWGTFEPKTFNATGEAAWLRTGQGFDEAAPYAYIVDGSHDQAQFIDMGADGEIPDKDPNSGFQPTSDTVGEISSLASIVSSRTDVRVATVNDDPFRHTPGYGVRIHVADTQGAGTDANVQVQLNGCNGSASFYEPIDGREPQMFERDTANYLNLMSKDLGELQSIKVTSDDQGIAPTWDIADVKISSAGYGIPYPGVATTETAELDNSSHTFTLPSGYGHPCTATVSGVGQFGTSPPFFQVSSPIVGGFSGTPTCTKVTAKDSSNNELAINATLPTGSYTIDGSSCTGLTTTGNITVVGGAFYQGTTTINGNVWKASRTYGDANPADSAYILEGGPPGPSSTYGTPNCAEQFQTSSPVQEGPFGPTGVTGAVTQTSMADGYAVIGTATPAAGYTLASTRVNCELIINKAPLQVEPLPTTKPYGAIDPGASGTNNVTYTGFKNSETASSIGLSSAVNCRSETDALSTPANSPYAMTCVAASSPTNYRILDGTEEGMMTITAARPGVTLTPSTTSAFYPEPVTLRGGTTHPDRTEPALYPSGTMTISDGSATLGTLSASGCCDLWGHLESVLNAGTHSITASLPTDGNYAAGSSTVTVLVNKGPTTLSAAHTGGLFPKFSAKLTRTRGGAPVAGEKVAFGFGAGPVCTAVTDATGNASCSALVVALGVSSYTATFAGGANWVSSQATASYGLLG